MIRKSLLAVFLAGALSLAAGAQQPDSTALKALSAKLDEYFANLAGEPADVQAKECDFIISACKDSLVRQWTALKIYDHYLQSKIMGDEAVAIYVADRWLLSGEIPFMNEVDRINAGIFAEFNRQSLIGNKAPELTLQDHNMLPVRPLERSAGKYVLLYFYDTDCATCAVETVRLMQFLSGWEEPLDVYAVYVGDVEEAWARYRAMNLNRPGIVHLWDPEMESDFQRKYGVLQTPGMFLVGPDGTILGRRLDTDALGRLLAKQFAPEEYDYNSETTRAFFDTLFGEDVNDSDIVNMADYLLSKARAEQSDGDFRHLTGDLLFYFTGRRGESFRNATKLLIEKYIRPYDADPEVASLADFTYGLLTRTPVGEPLPALSVHGTLRRRPCLFRKGMKTGVFDLSALRGDPVYLVFHTSGCANCEATLSAVERRLKEDPADRKARFLLIDMDLLMTSYPEEARTVLDTFDLSVLPFVLQARDGRVTRKYMEL